jgi:hypothetical protein
MQGKPDQEVDAHKEDENVILSQMDCTGIEPMTIGLKILGK